MARSYTVIEGNDAQYKEGEVASGATVYPGMLLEITGTNSDGDPLVQPQSTDDYGDADVRIALTPGSPPKGDDADIPRNHEYSAGENIQFERFQPGDVIQNGLLADGTAITTAANATVSPGDKLVTASGGSVRTGGTGGNAIAEALESQDNSGGSGTEAGGGLARVEFEVIR